MSSICELASLIVLCAFLRASVISGFFFQFFFFIFIEIMSSVELLFSLNIVFASFS